MAIYDAMKATAEAAAHMDTETGELTGDPVLQVTNFVALALTPKATGQAEMTIAGLRGLAGDILS